MTQSNSSNFGRGIDSIAHLFLTQSARDVPRRRPPGSPESSYEVGKIPEPVRHDPVSQENNDADDMKPQENCNSFDDIPEYGQEDKELIMGEVVLAYHLENSLEMARSYADAVTRRDEKVALVNVNNIEASLIPFGDLVETAHQQPHIISETEDVAGSLIPALNDLARNGIVSDFGMEGTMLDNLLINIDRGFSPRIGEMACYCEYLTIVTTCESDDIVEAYRIIKAMSAQVDKTHEIALFVCNAPDTQTADEVYYKLADTTKKFLDRVLVPAGCSLIEDKGDQAPSSEDLYEEITESEHEKLDDCSWDESENDIPELQEACKDIFPVVNEADMEVEELDVEDSLDSQQQEQCESPKSQPIPSVAQEPKVVHQEVPAKQAAPMILNSINTNKLPQTNQELASYLLLSLPQWLKSLPTAMVLPHGIPQAVHPDTHVLIDAAGRLHIFVADLSADAAVLAGALNARKWLIDNLPMISSGCNQLNIDLTLEPGLVFVVTHGLDTLKNSAEQLTDIPCKFHQIHYLQNNPGWSLLIVPA